MQNMARGRYICFSLTEDFQQTNSLNLVTYTEDIVQVCDPQFGDLFGTGILSPMTCPGN